MATRQLQIGEVFTRLTVIGISGPKGGQITVKCVCGEIRQLLRAHLLSGNSKSCGCYNVSEIRKRFTKHGEVDQIDGKRVASPEYRAWQNMRNRCLNKNGQDYKYYGGRGITIDSAWDTFDGFLASMGRRPSIKHTLERRDGSKGYGPANCVWETRETQARNRKYAKTKSWELAETLGVKKATADHYIWLVRKYDKGESKKIGLGTDIEKLVRAHLAKIG